MSAICYVDHYFHNIIIIQQHRSSIRIQNALASACMGDRGEHGSAITRLLIMLVLQETFCLTQSFSKQLPFNILVLVQK
ncbi:hypothetical protein CW304_12125 [Bacillus sp. UFRGS-B20]|nr:hypothetical protein CW304_12125 [Bacillus sp. UFRGS-B20]